MLSWMTSKRSSGAANCSKQSAEQMCRTEPQESGPTLLKHRDTADHTQKANATSPELDLVFMCDCTGSMGEYIFAAQQNIRSIVERVTRSEKADVRFALVSYRDHPPEDTSYITQVHPFTSDVEVMKGYVDTMSAAGGGDGPEAVTAALHDALHLPWRAAATKIAILIADAPPHGLEPSGDGFPNGDPQGRDPLSIAREMAVQEITCYTVGCEPALGCYSFARDFMCTLAEITGGQAVALGSAALLAEVIVNGSAEEISMTMLQREVENEVDHVRHMAESAGEQLDDEAVYRRATTNLHARNVRTKQMRTDGGRMQNAHGSVWHKSEKQTLAATKVELCAVEQLDIDTNAPRLSRRRRKASAPRGMPSALASVLRRGSRDSKESCADAAPTFERRPCRSSRAATAHSDDMSFSDEEHGMYHTRCSSPRERCAASHVGSTVMSKAELAEDLITVDQVSRIAARYTHKKCGM
jgi:hypothetical protein